MPPLSSARRSRCLRRSSSEGIRAARDLDTILSLKNLEANQQQLPHVRLTALWVVNRARAFGGSRRPQNPAGFDFIDKRLRVLSTAAVWVVRIRVDGMKQPVPAEGGLPALALPMGPLVRT